MAKIRAALYARTSTTDRQDPETQLLDLRNLAASKGWEIVAQFVDQMSGSTERRPGLDALMDGARAKHFDVVMVWRFDRFGRSTRHLLDGLAEFQKAGVSFVSFSEAIDTGSSVGQLVYSVLAAIGSFERDMIRERVRAGLRRAKSQGKRIGRPKRVWTDEVMALKERGRSVQEIQDELKISRAAVYRVFKLSQKRA